MKISKWTLIDSQYNKKKLNNQYLKSQMTLNGGIHISSNVNQNQAQHIFFVTL